MTFNLNITHRIRYAIAILAAMASACTQSTESNHSAPPTARDGVFTPEQIQKGAETYNSYCVACHGRDLRGSEGGTALTGERFQSRWKDESIGSLFTLTKNSMPKSSPASLDDEAYAALTAFMLNVNGFKPGDQELSPRVDALNAITIGLPPPPDRSSARFTPKPYDSTPPTIDAEWLQHRGDMASTNYSALDQINSGNVSRLKIIWRWKTDNFGPAPEFYFKVTPIMANGVLYTTAGLSRSVAAIDARTGETLWTYRHDEKERKTYVPRQNSGRGVAYWASPNRARDRIIFITPGFQLIALEASTGQRVADFGESGVVDLKKALGVDPLTSTIGSTSPPIIVNDVIVVGSTFPVGLAPVSKTQVRGDILGYDVRTGKKLWTFHTIPQKGEEGNETWENNSWEYTGNVAAWAPLTADAALGFVYLPLEAPTGDFYGGHRPGNNLFSQSLVCLNAKTGKRVWHYQMVHHDIWDYDLPCPPILTDITVEGKPIKAVVQLTKQAFAFVLDRVTGKPVWPIEERPVPKSDVPGEWTSPTQPIPTRPAPFDVQGFSEEIVVDFTPDIKRRALKIVSSYKTGPLYTPISIYDPVNNPGTLVLPDAVGGANWQGGAFDPETGVLYVSSSTILRPMSLEHAPELSDMDFIAYQGSSKIGPYNIPLVKPPYGRITAIDLNTGNHKWMMANAETPQWLKDVPALRDIEIPATGNPDRVGLLVTKTLLFAGTGSGMYASDYPGTNRFRAYDKNTGAVIHEMELPANQCGIPMTYSIDGKQYIVIAVGAPGHPGELVALSL